MRRRTAALAMLGGLLVGVPVLVHRARRPAGVAVEVERVGLRALQPSIVASGVLAYAEQVTLTAEVLGRVSAVEVAEGDSVAAGQVVLRLDAETYRAEIAQLAATREQAKVAIAKARLELEQQSRLQARYAPLGPLGMVEAVRLDEIESRRSAASLGLAHAKEALRQAEAQLRQARERMARTVIRAPIAGRVIALSIKPGETAVPTAGGVPGSVLMVIADTRRRVAELNVDESDIGRVTRGQAVNVFPAGAPDRALRGVVTSIALVPKVAAGQQGRSYVVRAALALDAPAFQSGMSCRGELAVGDAAPRLTVPLRAVLSASAPESEAGLPRAHVFRRTAGRAEKVAIEGGVSDDRYLEVRAGLRAGDEVVVGPSRVLKHLRAGDALRIGPP